MPFSALSKITIIECSTFVTGPYAAWLLAELGARVIKVEPVPDGDPYRYFAPDPLFSPYFAHLNRNKESIALNLKTDAGKRICTDLVKMADVFIENFRPGVAGRLGLGYEAMSSLNRKLIYCSISAFGQTGPYADKPGFDTLGQAMGGLQSVLTDLEDPKVMGIALSDYVTGLSAGYGILGALHARQQTGQGSKMETSLLQSTLSFIGEAAAGYLRTKAVPTRISRVKNAHAFAVLAKDRLPLVIHCSVPEKFWKALLKAIGREDLASDKKFRTRDLRRKNYVELEKKLAFTFRKKPRREWLKILEANDVPAAPLYNMEEVLRDPQVVHLGLMEEIQHPVGGKMKFVGAPVSYVGLSKKPSQPPPVVGEHTGSLLSELGLSRSAVERLEKEGVILRPK